VRETQNHASFMGPQPIADVHLLLLTIFSESFNVYVEPWTGQFAPSGDPRDLEAPTFGTLSSSYFASGRTG
jgi:hypothetical protein